MEVIDHLKAIGRHYAPVIFGIMLRMPILFCLDGYLRTRLIRGNLPICAGLCLLLLSNQCLASVYSAFVCFQFMLSTWPLSKHVIATNSLTDGELIIWKSISNQQNFYFAWYLQVAVVFFAFPLTVTMLRHIITTVCNLHKRLCITGLIVFEMFLWSTRFDISEFPLLFNIYRLVYQLLIFILTNDVFRLHKYVYCGLIFLYCNTVQAESWPHPTIIWIIIIEWLTINRGENPIYGAFESLKVYVTGFRLTFESVKDNIVAVILPYAILLCIGLPCVLYKNNITQPTLDHVDIVQVFAVMSTTILGIIAYIVLITYICYGCIRLTLWFLHGRYKGPEISIPISPGIIFIVLEIQVFPIEPLLHGRLMCFGILLIGPSMLEDIHKVSAPILLEHCISGANLIKQIKTISIFIILIFFPIFVLIMFYQHDQLQLHNLGMIWAIVMTLSWVPVCIEALGTIAVYCLLVYDKIKSEPFKNLDDGMYCIKALVCVVEIAVGFLNICCVTWLITNVHWSWIGFIILGCCPYQRVKNGWNEFQRRRWTVKMLAFLPNATLTQLNENDDVCAICLRNMSTAKITPCNHFFHESCLRKWCYVRETCPCCNKVINVDWFVQRVLRLSAPGIDHGQ